LGLGRRGDPTPPPARTSSRRTTNLVACVGENDRASPEPPTAQSPKAYVAVKGVLFAMCSLTLRECWHVVLGAGWMLLARQEIKKARKERGKEDGEAHATSGVIVEGEC
jgi:hypothetical protein